MNFHWEDGDLLYYELSAREDFVDKTEFTRTGLSVDHGYLIAPEVSMNEAMYMMGYYGKPSKHLESHYKQVNQGGTVFLSYDHDYTYTLADGHIVELVEDATTTVRLPVMDRITKSKITSTFTYEEYQ